jgi:hypothetical protein
LEVGRVVSPNIHKIVILLSEDIGKTWTEENKIKQKHKQKIISISLPPCLKDNYFQDN